jgi:hypothetical protein
MAVLSVAAMPLFAFIPRHDALAFFRSQTPDAIRHSSDALYGDLPGRVGGLVPYYGQAADVRDIAANAKNVAAAPSNKDADIGSTVMERDCLSNAMNLDKVIAEIIFLPLRLTREDGKSMHMILAELGYATIRNKISIELILHGILQNPEMIQGWLEYSSDKRTSNGWYFKIGNDHEYIVGSVDCKKVDKFINVSEACATFIKRELECIIT